MSFAFNWVMRKEKRDGNNGDVGHFCSIEAYKSTYETVEELCSHMVSKNG